MLHYEFWITRKHEIVQKCPEVNSVSVDWDCHLLFPLASPNLWLMDAELSAPVTISSDSPWLLSGSVGVDRVMSTWIIPYPVTSQLTRAGVVTWSMFISVSQPTIVFLPSLVGLKDYWIILLRIYFLMNVCKEKSIRKFRTRWTHWPCHEPLAQLQIPIVILCLSFVTIAPGATRLQPWESGDNGKLFTSPVGDTSRQNFPLHSTKMPQFKFVWIKIMLQSCSYKSRKNWRPHVSFVCNQREFSSAKH